MDVQEVIKKVANENGIKLDFNKPETTLKDVGIDSLSMMDLIVKIEDRLNVRINDNDLVKIKTLKDLVDTFKETLTAQK